MARSGISRIDNLFEAAAGSSPLAPEDEDRESVGAIQDLLRGHGFRAMPGAAHSSYGLFGPKTKEAVRGFREQQSLPAGELVDAEMLRKLIEVEAMEPIASRSYVTLGLDLNWSGMTKVLLLTSLLEGMGQFGALNKNTDKAGLSFGIIQWAQRPGRLSEVLEAFQADNPPEYTRIFGDGVLAHTKLANGGVDPNTGRTTDSAFNLIRSPWTDRFLEAARRRDWQKVQIETAMKAFRASLQIIHSYAPEMTTERGVAFMLDLANQCGDGGARKLYRDTKKEGISLDQHMEAMSQTSLTLVAEKFRKGVLERRRTFMETPMLSDTVQVA
ncbi:MAG: peptidoglycan-binding protein [Acidimicrobiia bacterium]|nr:peptidoglycan-binding protein [Acidimicrobiia bacterium]